MRAAVCRWAFAVLVSMIVTPGLAAQDAESDDAAEMRRRFRSIEWDEGPTTGALGSEAEIQIPEGCRFTGAPGTKTFMELNQNPTDGDERGTILCQGPQEGSGVWFVVLTYRGSGYVKDDDRSEIDSSKLLATLRKGNKIGNAERRKRGWETLELDDWQTPPYYDQRTNNLTWGLRLIDASGDTTINHSVRLLGRGGVMEVDLVAGPTLAEAALPDFEAMLEGFSYLPGQRYAEWRAGDKIAEYGLTALIAGGAGAVAAKSGLLGKLGKGLIALAVAAVAGLKGIISRVLGRKSNSAA
jgi:uncharacterized membrane-anchored protein